MTLEKNRLFELLYPNGAPTTGSSSADFGEKVMVGMVHLSALPGSPGFGGNVDEILQRAAADARRLVEAGFSCLMLENFGDAPFFPGRVPRHVVAFMTAVAGHVRETVKEAALGINVLRNDGLSALEVAAASRASFIRVNVLAGARLSDQGILQGIAHDLLRLRKTLGGDDVSILADVSVKHSSPLAPLSIEQEVEDLITRAGADGLVVTGTGTGHCPGTPLVEKVRRAARSRATGAGPIPILCGSGVTSENLGSYWPHVDGVIVGSSLKEDDRATSPVSFSKAKVFVEKARELSRGELKSR